MQNVRFEGKKIVITKELRKVILDLLNENNYSDSTKDNDDIIITPKKTFRKKYH